MKELLMETREYNLYYKGNRIFIQYDNRVSTEEDYFIQLEGFDELVDLKALTNIHNKLTKVIEELIYMS